MFCVLAASCSGIFRPWSCKKELCGRQVELQRRGKERNRSRK